MIEFRWAGGQYDRLPALAADLVDHRVSVLVAVGGDPSAVAAKHATSTIPIVFGMGGDPIKAGLVESFSRPGGNMTGFSILASQLEPKRLGLLHEVQPNIPLFGALLNPNFPPAIRQLQELEEAANTIQQKLVVSKASTDGELDASFASLIQAHVGGLIVASDPYFDTRRDRIDHIRGATAATCHLRFSRICHRGWPDELWREPRRSIPTVRRVRGQYSQGSETRRSAGATGGQIRIGNQLEDRAGARH